MHVALLLAQPQLVEARGDRLRIDRRERIAGEERIVRARQHLAAPARRSDPRRATAIAWRCVHRPAAALAADRPGDELGLVALADALPRARQLGPGVRLVPVHPPAAELDVVAAPVAVPGAPAEPVARLDQRAVEPGERQLARGGDAGEPPADDDGIEHARSLADS